VYFDHTTIVEEVRAAREAYAARFGYDLKHMFEDLKKNEMENTGPRANLWPLKPAKSKHYSRGRSQIRAKRRHRDHVLFRLPQRPLKHHTSFAGCSSAAGEKIISVPGLTAKASFSLRARAGDSRRQNACRPKTPCWPQESIVQRVVGQIPCGHIPERAFAPACGSL